MKSKKQKRAYIQIMLMFLLLFVTTDYKNGKRHLYYNTSNTEISYFDKDYHYLKDDVAVNVQIKTRIYINPSVQTWNKYVNELGDEAQHMNIIASLVVQNLEKYQNIEVKANLNNLSLNRSIKESNAWSPDIHLALHSNGGGGMGSEVYTKNDPLFANLLLDNFIKKTSFLSRGVKNGEHLYEVKQSKATHVALFEVLFHDNEFEAAYIVNNHHFIADNITETIISFVNDYSK